MTEESFSVEWSNLTAARIVFVKAMHEIKQSVCDTLRIIMNSVSLYNLPPRGTSHTLETTDLKKEEK
jgi:hypothetical protein